METLGNLIFSPPDTRNAVESEDIALVEAVRNVLAALGEDVESEGLLETPERVARMLREFTSSRHLSPGDEITCEFHERDAGLVLVKDILFNSTCEHHLLPFHGVAHIAYLPREGRITGLSKLARVVETASKRLQVQERMTRQIAQALCERLDPLGVFVMLEAEHSCMSLRGIRKPGARTVTTDVRGIYCENDALRRELLSLIQKD